MSKLQKKINLYALVATTSTSKQHSPRPLLQSFSANGAIFHFRETLTPGVAKQFSDERPLI